MTGHDAHHEERSAAKVSIALIGYRGAGKSAVGREVAAITGGLHVDADDLLRERAGRLISAVFESEGEAGFRRLEADAVKEGLARKPVVISVGGGAVLDQRNVDLLRSAAFVVWLTAPAETLWQRIRDDEAGTDSRPALTDRSGLDEVRALLAQREPLYRQVADLIVDTSDLSPADVARRILKLYRRRRASENVHLRS